MAYAGRNLKSSQGWPKGPRSWIYSEAPSCQLTTQHDCHMSPDLKLICPLFLCSSNPTLLWQDFFMCKAWSNLGNLGSPALRCRSCKSQLGAESKIGTKSPGWLLQCIRFLLAPQSRTQAQGPYSCPVILLSCLFFSCLSCSLVLLLLVVVVVVAAAVVVVVVVVLVLVLVLVLLLLLLVFLLWLWLLWLWFLTETGTSNQQETTITTTTTDNKDDNYHNHHVNCKLV